MTTRYGPQQDLHVTLMSRREAERWTRNAYNVPDGVGLGWTPYTILVTSYGYTAHTAFHSVRELKRWLGRDYRVAITGPWQHQGIRSGRVVSAEVESLT